jgi:hypothetical protein
MVIPAPTINDFKICFIHLIFALFPAFEKGFDPSDGDGFPAVHSAQQRAANGGVGVSVAAAHDSVHDGLL